MTDARPSITGGTIVGTPGAPSAEAEPASRAGPRLAFLDGMRALAAIAVVWHHAYQTATGDGSLRRHATMLRYGNFAVAVFIVISGYSLAIAARRRGHGQRFWEFMRRRAWRILPPYLAALLLSTGLILTVIGTKTGTAWDEVLPLSGVGVVVNALLLQDLVPARAPNHVFWSIAIEWHLYLLFPLLLALGRRAPRWCLLVVAALGCALLWPVYSGNPYTGFPPQFLALFVLGVVAADVETEPLGRLHRPRWFLQPTLAFGALVIALPAAMILAGADRSFFAAELLLGGVVAAFVVALSAGPVEHPLRRFLDWRPLAWVGLFSYSLYLIHAPVLQIVWQYFVHPLDLGPNSEFVTTLAAATVSSVAAAYLFHLVFERPFMNHRSLRALVGRLHSVKASPHLPPPGPVTVAPVPGTGPARRLDTAAAASGGWARLDEALDFGAAVTTVLLLLFAGVGVVGPPRVVVALAFVSFVPGWAVVDWMPFSAGAAKVAVAVVLSLAICAGLALAQLWVDLWRPVGVFDVVALASLAGVVAHLLRQDRRLRLAVPRP